MKIALLKSIIGLLENERDLRKTKGPAPIIEKFRREEKKGKSTGKSMEIKKTAKKKQFMPL